MNKQEAYQSMLQGNKVCNEYYSPEEYAFINSDGLIEYEDGCVVGNEQSENWVKYQDPECKFEWSIWTDPNFNIKSDIKSMKEAQLGNGISLLFPFAKQISYESPQIYFTSKQFVSKNSHKRTNHKNK